jgi:hypothetical protein
MQRGFVTSFPISPKIARERSRGFEIDMNSEGLLRVWLADGWSAFAKVGDRTNAATAIIVRVIDLRNGVANVSVMRAVTPATAVGSAIGGMETTPGLTAY